MKRSLQRLIKAQRYVTSLKRIRVISRHDFNSRPRSKGLIRTRLCSYRIKRQWSELDDVVFGRRIKESTRNVEQAMNCSFLATERFPPSLNHDPLIYYLNKRLDHETLLSGCNSFLRKIKIRKYIYLLFTCIWKDKRWSKTLRILSKSIQMSTIIDRSRND